MLDLFEICAKTAVTSWNMFMQNMAYIMMDKLLNKLNFGYSRSLVSVMLTC